MEIRGTSCCGIKELVSIGSHKPATIVATVKHWTASGRKYPHFIFSSVTRSKYGEALDAYIQEHNLGIVVGTPSKRNPNSGNAIRGWFWTPNWPALNRWEAPRGTEPARLDDW